MRGDAPPCGPGGDASDPVQNAGLRTGSNTNSTEESLIGTAPTSGAAPTGGGYCRTPNTAETINRESFDHQGTDGRTESRHAYSQYEYGVESRGACLQDRTPSDRRVAHDMRTWCWSGLLLGVALYSYQDSQAPAARLASSTAPRRTAEGAAVVPLAATSSARRRRSLDAAAGLGRCGRRAVVVFYATPDLGDLRLAALRPGLLLRPRCGVSSCAAPARGVAKMNAGSACAGSGSTAAQDPCRILRVIRS